MNKAAHGVLVSLIALFARDVFADGRGGGVMGYVEDNRGTPVSGAVVSLFGRGIGPSGLVTLTDSAGHFVVQSLPAGSYTLRALGVGHLPALARRITVLPDHQSSFTLSLIPLGSEDQTESETQADDQDDAARELRWLLRHKQRSVLEAHAHQQPAERQSPAEPSWLPGVGGTLEVMASPASITPGQDSGANPGLASNLGAVRLGGRFGQGGHWNLGGLLAESESATWRMAGEFVIEPGNGHELQLGTGYGSRLRRSLTQQEIEGRVDSQNVGALFVQDRWQAGKRLAVSVGGRFTYIGFLDEHNHLDPVAQLELAPDDRTRLSGSISTHSQVPGGDLLTLSTLAAAPALAYAVMDPRLRPERTTRYELALDQRLGSTSVRAHTFYEDTSDQLLNAFVGPVHGRIVHISNRGSLAARGMGVSLSRRAGQFVSGSVSYNYGHALAPLTAGQVLGRQGKAEFHDLVTRVETSIEGTDTRLVAYCRLSRVLPDGADGVGVSPDLQARYEIQLSQGLPFLTGFTRADWDVLVAVRNLFYEPGEGALLDEVSVANPPKRFLGGISVRF